jgi:hypothetical protein
MLLQNFPYLETIVSGVSAYLLGWVWYHPKVLGKTWIEARGKTVDDIKPKVFFSMVSFVLWMTAACFYSFLVLIMDMQISPGLFCLSCLLWVAFAMPPTVMGAFYTGYPFNAAAIDSSYQLAGYYLFALVHMGLGAVAHGSGSLVQPG